MAPKVFPDRRPLNARQPIRQTVEFAIVNGNLRQNCALRTTFLSRSEAMSYLKNNRGKIDAAAKRRWAEGFVKDGVVYLDMI
ncbi:MAG: hypothetical protein WBF99_12420 [Xanthobacteraceae bacterium]